MPSIPIADLGLDLSVGYEGVTEVFPSLTVVPMGWSWAMWIAQRIHQHQACLALDFPPSQVLADGRPPPSLMGGTPAITPYADNLNVCGTDRARVPQAKDAVVSRLRAVGFRVHEEEDANPVAQALGFVLDGERGEIRPVTQKRDKLRLVLQWLASRPKVSGKVIESVIGHTCCAGSSSPSLGRLTTLRWLITLNLRSSGSQLRISMGCSHAISLSL